MLKKISSIAFAFIISLSLLSPAFAAETITKTYKFNPTSKEDLTYNAPLLMLLVIEVILRLNLK